MRVLATLLPCVLVSACAPPKHPALAPERGSDAKRIETMCRRGEGQAQRHLRLHRFGQIEFGVTSTDCSFSFADRFGSNFTYRVESNGCVVDREREAFAGCYNAAMDEALDAAELHATVLRLRRQRC